MKAVAHASRILLINYSQIEKEALILAVNIHKMWHCRFMQTDHKALLAIFGSKKWISIEAASRLQ